MTNEKIIDLIQYSAITENNYCNPLNGTYMPMQSYKTALVNLKNVIKIFDSYSNLNILNYDSIVFFDCNNNYIGGYQPICSNNSEKSNYNGHYGIYYNIPHNASTAVVNLIKSRDSIRYIITLISEQKSVCFFEGKKIINFGDSIFGNFRDQNENDKSISRMISEQTGAEVFNAGFGGCRMAKHLKYWDAFSMHSLADSISKNDWLKQSLAISESRSEPDDGIQKLPDYFNETISMLKKIDFSKIDYLTICYGTNDYTGNIPIKDYYDALNNSIEKILLSYPNIRIIILSPCWRWWANDNHYAYSSDDIQSLNKLGLFLQNYVVICSKIGQMFHIPFINLYDDLGFNKFTISMYFNGLDGTHPNQAGRQLIAERIIGGLFSHY